MPPLSGVAATLYRTLLFDSGDMTRQSSITIRIRDIITTSAMAIRFVVIIDMHLYRR